MSANGNTAIDDAENLGPVLILELFSEIKHVAYVK